MEPGTIVILSVLGIFIFLVLLRWFLAIDRQLKNQRSVITLLTKLCQYHGIDTSEPAAHQKKTGFNK